MCLLTPFYFRNSTSDSSGKDCLKALQFVRYNLAVAAVQSCISAGELGETLQGVRNQQNSAVWRRVITTETQPVWLEEIVVVICSTVQ